MTMPEVPTRPMSDPVAERAVLGAMLLSPDVADQVTEILTAEDFAAPANRVVFTAILRALMLGEPTDVNAIGSRLHAAGEFTQGHLEQLGGGAYLASLPGAVSAPAEGIWFAQQVLEYARVRRMDVALGRAHVALRTPGRSVVEVVEEIQQTIHEATVNADEQGPKAAGDVVFEVIERIEAVADGEVKPGISSGLGALDEVTGGWLPGQLVIPAARPGMGKTLAAMGFAKACARQGRPALFFSTEMLYGELMQRLISDVSGVEHERIKRGTIDRRDRERIHAAGKEIAALPLHIVDTAHDTATIRSMSRRFRQQHGDLGLVAVDYVQRLRPLQKFERNDLEIGQHAKDLKWVAVDLETTVVAVCQLNRGPEQRTDKRPGLADLRGSGELEQEADIVIMLHREDYYDPESPKAGEAEFIVAKNRAGRLDTADVAAQLHVCRFVDFGTD